jgi:hypothetical protein
MERAGDLLAVGRTNPAAGGERRQGRKCVKEIWSG